MQVCSAIDSLPFSSPLQECLLDKHHHVAVALGKQDGSNFNVSCKKKKATNSTWFTQDYFKLPFKTTNSPFTQNAGSSATPPGFTLLTFSELVSGATPLSDEDPAYWESFQSKKEAPVRQTEMQ